MTPQLALLLSALSLQLAACASESNDFDGDGYLNDDCRTHYAAIHPGAEDPYGDGVDQDCDGWDGSQAEFDADGDGYRSEDFDGQDCDDGDSAVHPDAVEVCGDGQVNDCARSAASAALDCRVEGDLLVEGRSTVVVGHAAGAWAGRSLAGVGDVDGDGLDDVLVGAPGSVVRDDVVGAVYLILSTSGQTVDMASGDAAMLVGASPGDGAGFGLSGVGDLDGDGLTDIAVGVVDTDGASDGVGGAVHVIMGPTPESDDGSPVQLAADAYLTIDGPAGFGAAEALITDVDDDSRGDLLVGAPNAYDERGSVYLYTAADIDAGAAAGAVATTDAATMEVVGRHEATDDVSGSLLGWSTCGADIDGDGVAEMVIGAYRDASSSDRTYEGSVSAMSVHPGVYTVDEAELTLFGGTSYDNLGWSVACGDLTGDGYAELVLGALSLNGGGDRPGKAYLIPASQFGPGGPVDVEDVSLAVFTGSFDGESVGCSVSIPGDMDGDQADDLMVGACAYGARSERSGSAHLFYSSAGLEGQISVSSADAIMAGPSIGDIAGVAAAGAGDVDGDGWPDLIVGAPFDSQSGTESGRAYILYGGGY